MKRFGDVDLAVKLNYKDMCSGAFLVNKELRNILARCVYISGDVQAEQRMCFSMFIVVGHRVEPMKWLRKRLLHRVGMGVASGLICLLGVVFIYVDLVKLSVIFNFQIAFFQF